MRKIITFTLNDIAVVPQKEEPSQPKVWSGLPPKGTWFRVHPTAVFSNAKVLYTPGDRRWYLLGNDLGDCAGNYGADLHVGVDSYGHPWVLVASHASSTDMRAVMEQAKTVWMRRAVGQVLVFEDNPAMRDIEPVWPEPLDLEALLNTAFGEEFYIHDRHHPLLKPRGRAA